MDILTIENLEKKYDSGTHALKNINLTIKKGELFSLSGQMAKAKPHVLGVVCGTVSKTGGTIHIGKYDADKDWRAVRRLIGYVPQELTLNPLDTVWDTIVYQRGCRPKRETTLFSKKFYAIFRSGKNVQQ